MLKQTTGNRDAGFIDQGVELKVKSDIQCVFVALMLGKAFAPRPARLFCFSALLLPPLPALIWVYVLNGTGFFNKFTAL